MVNIILNDISIDKNFYMFILKLLKLIVLIDSLIVIKNLKLFRFWFIIGKLSYVLSMLDNICYNNIV